MSGKYRSDKGVSRTHGECINGKKSSRYETWMTMKKRCNNPKYRDFFRYGARGIKVCDRWNDFANFLADMGDRPPGMELERKDNDGPYAPWNCIWATKAQQARNRRTNIQISYHGETLCLKDWCARIGFKYTTVRARILCYGWTIERAFSEPIGGCNA